MYLQLIAFKFETFVRIVISQTLKVCCGKFKKATIEFRLGQDATTDDEAIFLIAHIERRDRWVMRYLCKWMKCWI